MSTPNKKYAKWLFLIPIVVIATCNIIINTRDENADKAITKNPQPGDYYVFFRQGGKLNLPFKVKSVDKESIRFYVPRYELGLLTNDHAKFRSYLLDTELKKDLYGDLTINIDRAVLDSMTNEKIEKKKYEIAEGLTLAFVDSYRGSAKR